MIEKLIIGDMKPKYSGKQIIKAGEALVDTKAMLKDKEKFSSAMDVLSYWRFSHEEALDKAFSHLQEVTLRKDKKAIFAKRLKRHPSIVRKLRRFNSMKLKNMQDIGGCRAVLSNYKKLKQTLREIKKAPGFRNISGTFKYKDYIKNPKDDGYRSFHLIGQFSNSSGQKRNIEIQLRTKLQHYWATALEIVDLFTDQALKSNQGDVIWKQFFIHVAEQFAIMDNIHMFETLSRDNKYIDFHKKINGSEDLLLALDRTKKFCEMLNVFETFSAFANSLHIIEDTLNKRPHDIGYVLLKIDPPNGSVTTKIFKSEDSKIAEAEYIKEEKFATKSKEVVAFVSTSAVGDIKEAYPNYFADSTKFLDHLGIITNNKRI